ncbi:MAG: hypothetical protein ACHQXL_06505 [Candidatus Limnocylindrales bacterium]
MDTETTPLGIRRIQLATDLRAASEAAAERAIALATEHKAE